MKALILAAGFGTRLHPFTQTLPKPLFTINDRPALDLTIDKLVSCGCDTIFINTHHLSEQIQAFVDGHPHRDMLEIVFEPEILDTGGAIANLRHAFSNAPFLVINSDIICDLDLKQVIDYHLASDTIATLVLHDCPRFNKISINARKQVMDFNGSRNTGLAFTGIQVISPEFFNHMPDTPVFSSIDVYKKLCTSNKISAFVAKDLYWKDIGTIQSYQETSRECLSGKVFNLPLSELKEMEIAPIAGDGSDRLWFRAVHNEKTLVISDHDICPDPSENLSQLKAFVNIGTHLNACKLPVPKILGHDSLSGQVAVEDLGNTHLADHIKGLKTELDNKLDETAILHTYKQVIDALIQFSQNGIKGFNSQWTCQTPTYSKELILEKECRYFMEAFVRGYLNLDVQGAPLDSAFSHIADNALAHGLTGLMHRDMQSKNIMINREDIYFIDFQSARIGPLQYDLASLFIDPYVILPDKIQSTLLVYAMSALGIESPVEKDNFQHSYEYCCLTRNLQILGAFGFLSRVKGKLQIASYIPHALTSLRLRLEIMETAMDSKSMAPLTQFVKRLEEYV